MNFTPRDWIAHRFGLRPIKEHFLERRVAKSAWYFGGGASLVLLLGTQVMTGVVLALSYIPTPDAAYESVRHITQRQAMGGFVRALHYWSGGLMVIMTIYHLLRQVLVGGYKFPREGTWLIGVVMFFCIMVMGFTGYVLRWDERAVYAMQVVLHMFYYVPVIGDELVLLVQGGPNLGEFTATRLYAVHVVLVPLVLLGLTGYHLYLVVLHGTTSPAERRQPIRTVQEQKQAYDSDAQSQERGEAFFPYTAARSTAMAVTIFAIAVGLAVVYGPRELYPQANLVEPSFPVEEWWFSWYSSAIALLPPGVAQLFIVLFPVALLVVLVLLPFVDRGPYRGFRKRPLAAVAVAACVVGFVFLTGLRARSPWTGWPSAEPPAIPAGIVLTDDAERGRLLFARYGCTSCHAVGGPGPQIGPDLARPPEPRSESFLRQFILRPPPGIAMPGYEGRLTDEELSQIVAFVLVAQTFPREQR